MVNLSTRSHVSWTVIHPKSWKGCSKKFRYRIMDDLELKARDPSSEPQPRHVARRDVLDACLKMRFFGCITGGDGKRSGTEIRKRTPGLHRDRLHTLAHRACGEVPR